MDESAAMRRALELAWQGWGRVHPNPMVGAVLLRDGVIVGEGAHREFGGPHAEIEALRSSDDPRNATCVVTLEPCAHYGKTPPCADALIDGAISRVVYAVDDPSVGAGGAARLREAGIAVEGGTLADDASRMNAPFFFGQEETQRPWVALKMATSLDGFLADAAGRSQWIAGPQALDYVHWLRAGFDAIGVGRGTAVADDPNLTVRGAVEPRVPPIRVVFSRTGRLPLDRVLVRTAREVPTVLVARVEEQDAARASLDPAGVRVIGADTIMAALGALRNAGIQRLLVEGGAGMARALLEADLVDRLYWVQAPCMLGGGLRAFAAAPTPLDDAHRWHVVERKALGQDTLLVVDRERCLPES